MLSKAYQRNHNACKHSRPCLCRISKSWSHLRTWTSVELTNIGRPLDILWQWTSSWSFYMRYYFHVLLYFFCILLHAIMFLTQFLWSIRGMYQRPPMLLAPSILRTRKNLQCMVYRMQSRKQSWKPLRLSVAGILSRRWLLPILPTDLPLRRRYIQNPDLFYFYTLLYANYVLTYQPLHFCS